jgi:RNA polymerase sigma-70 factor (ECF subfamily)
MMIRNGRTDRDDRFTDYYQRYFRRVQRYFMAAFKVAEEDAAELAQDTFVRFYDAMEEYRGDAEWAYFESIARNVAYNRIRSTLTLKRNARIVEIDDPEFNDEPAAPPEPDYAERQETASRRKRLHDAIDELPAGQRQCMRLWLEDFKYEDIAKALRITIDAVKSRLRDARKQLHARLGDDGALPEDEQ